MFEEPIGALWLKTDKKGRDYLTGNLEIKGEKVHITAFQNHKSKDTHPDFNIILSDKQQTASPAQSLRTRLRGGK